jgi:hypothetical protein
MSSERGDVKPEMIHADTDYERERALQIMNNKKLLDDVGLGGMGASVSLPASLKLTLQYARSRNASGISHERSRKASTPNKRRVLSVEAPGEWRVVLPRIRLTLA